MVFLGGSSCLLDPVEAPPATSSTLATVDTTVPTTSTAPLSTTTAAPTTTTAAPTTTTTTTAPTTAATFPSEVIRNYLKNLLTAEVGIARVVEELSTISNDWDNRSETDATYPETEEGMAAAVESMQTAGADFELIQPPPTAGYPAKHLRVASAVGQIALAAGEMLEGLRSTDTGEQRQAAQVGMVAAFGVFVESIDEVISEYIGDDEITALIVSRNLLAPAPAGPDDTTTTTTEAPATTTTTEAPATTTTTEAGG